MNARHLFSSSFVGLVLVAATVACSSSEADDPCGGGGTYTSSEVCSKMSGAVTAKCPGTTAEDCDKIVDPCKTTETFCRAGVDKGVTEINAAADCDGAGAVKLEFKCY